MNKRLFIKSKIDIAKGVLELGWSVFKEDPAWQHSSHRIRYGLIGRNGVGKSTLLRAMAERDGWGAEVSCKVWKMLIKKGFEHVCF